MTDYAAVPRTTEAVGSAAVARAVAERRGVPAACWGMAVFIASEAMLFAAAIATFFYLWLQNPAWPLPGDPEPAVLVPALFVGLLVLTSIPMQLASRGARAGRLARARVCLALVLIGQVVYLAYGVHDFFDQLGRFPAGTDAYSSTHYVLLALDHAHVAIGILFVVWLLGKLASGLTTYRVNGAQAIAWYWHAVVVITVAVYATLFSVRL
jgi:cytochrome c oxidase subunit III